MTIHQENEQATSGSNLLTPQEQAICKQIAAREAPHSQRALALLALNEKSTQAQAAKQAGLSTGQVKYWIAKFRKQRLGIFPDILLEEPDVETEVELVTEIEEEPESIPEKTDSAEDKTKDTKAKKGKKTKKKTKKTKKNTRKAKKDKKRKKAKKTKEKTRKAKKDKKRKKTKKTK
jgi:hypothetical protein